MSDKPADKPIDAPFDPALSPTAHYDEAAIKRARELLNNMPESVGPYRILERIGGGGMGEVWRAEQRSPIRRQVALKFIKLGMDSKAVLARFEAERQALALMDHPHIAKVFDAGTDDTGRPYFVMEYVKGKPITDYADQNHLTIRERLELFEQVCQAIQHAHHKGVIHRDLKPGNVLVSTQDDRPFAKVIDFGIAKAIAQRLTDETLFTQHDQFLGTPQYMSPEQAEGSVDIDTRTDVYSLGVLLYELLTGSPPFSTQDLRAAAFEQLKKLIIEVDPPKPSTRLTLNQPTLSTLAASRRTEPKRLGTLVQGELDWIVMKSLEKDRKRRYETPTSLANDIQAHLQGEPVQAAPPSTAYRIQKFVRKHRGPVIAVTAIAFVLLMGIIGTTWGYYRAERIAVLERQAKERESVAKQDANTQRDAAIQAQRLAVTAQDQTEGTLARGFIRPLVGEDNLSLNEIESLWELATLENDRIGLRMLDEATRNPQMTEQLLNCAEPALVAAVALNPELRRPALGLLRTRFNDSALALNHRADIGWLMLMLLSQPGPDSVACVSLIKREIAEVTPTDIPPQMYPVAYPKRVAALLEPSIAGELLLAIATDSRQNAHERFQLVQTLIALSARLEHFAAAQVLESASDALVMGIDEPHFSIFIRSADRGELTVLLERLAPTTTARIRKWASDKLVQFLSDPKMLRRNSQFATVFDTTLPVYIEGDTATRICESALVTLLLSLSDPVTTNRVQVANFIAELTACLPPETAAQVCESASNALLPFFNDPKWKNEGSYELTKALTALAAHLKPTAAERIADDLLAIISDSKWNDTDRKYVSDLLPSLSARLEPNVVLHVAERLLALITAPTSDGFDRPELAIALGRLAVNLEATMAARVCESASDALLRDLSEFDWSDGYPQRPAVALAVLAKSVTPSVATRIRESISVLLVKQLATAELTLEDISSFARALSALGGRTNPATSRAIAARIVRIMSNQMDFYSFLDSMPLITPHLPDGTRESVLRELCAIVFHDPSANSRGFFGDGNNLSCELLAIMQRLEPHHAAMATPSDDKAAATVSTDHAFSTLKLTTAEIVEFLKSPLVQGDHRRAFLDLLECRYGRRFGNQWAFVEYAQAENLGLDFTTSVKRPDPKAILQNIRTLLDEEPAK